MRITGTDVLAMSLGVVAVIFSGFVLAYSAWGGVAMLLSGALGLSIATFRGRYPAATATVWIAFVVLMARGVGGFLIGVGVFDDPEFEHDVDATLHESVTGDATVLVTGTLQNVGEGTAVNATVSVTLREANGNSLASGDVRLHDLRPGDHQLFFVRLGPDPDLSRYTSIEVEVTGEGEYDHLEPSKLIPMDREVPIWNS